MSHAQHELRSADEGFGIIEVVVAMFLLAITMLAFLPLLIQGLKTSSRNSTIAAATQIVNQEMEQARSAATGCLALLSFSSVTPAAVVGPSQVSLQATRTVDPCPASYPTTVTFTSSVSANGAVMSTATTEILVTHQ